MNKRAILTYLIPILIFLFAVFLFRNEILIYSFSEPQKTIDEHVEKIVPHISIERPNTYSKDTPIVIVFPGCLFLKSHNEDWHSLFVDLGYAVAVVDSFTARGIKDEELEKVCGGIKAQGFNLASDVLASVKYINQLDWVDKEKISLAGWSHGSWALMDTMAFFSKRESPRNVFGDISFEYMSNLDKIILFYPYCNIGSSAYSGFAWEENIETLLIIAGDDNSVGSKNCIEWFESQDNNSLEIEIYENADHTFDIPAPKNRNPSRFSKEYLSQSKERVIGFLTR